MFHDPQFTFWEVFFAGLGAASFWVKLSLERRKAYGLSVVLEQIIENPKIRLVLEFIIFVSFGAVVASAVVNPTTPAQAIAAGIGWTGFLSGPRKRGLAGG